MFPSKRFRAVQRRGRTSLVLRPEWRCLQAVPLRRMPRKQKQLRNIGRMQRTMQPPPRFVRSSQSYRSLRRTLSLLVLRSLRRRLRGIRLRRLFRKRQQIPRSRILRTTLQERRIGGDPSSGSNNANHPNSKHSRCCCVVFKTKTFTNSFDSQLRPATTLLYAIYPWKPETVPKTFRPTTSIRTNRNAVRLFIQAAKATPTDTTPKNSANASVEDLKSRVKA